MDSSETKTEQFIHLLSSNHYRIFAFIKSLVVNESDADDIMQDTSTIMWKKFDDFEMGTDFVAWGVTIAKYRILEHQKKHKDCSLSAETINLLVDQSEKMMPELDLRYHALQQCLSKLSRQDRNFLKLRYTYSYSGKMIANRVGTTLNMVYRHMSRIKLLLINCVDKQVRIGEY
jgi:RNA polymerase sigma-70 factor (ECF subfamily)